MFFWNSLAFSMILGNLISGSSPRKVLTWEICRKQCIREKYCLVYHGLHECDIEVPLHLLEASFGTTLAFWALSGFQASSQGAVGKIVISGKKGVVLVLMMVLVLVRACGLDEGRGEQYGVNPQLHALERR